MLYLNKKERTKFMGEGLAAIALALIVIFCTPMGWVGLTILGFIIYSIYEAKKGK